MPLLSYIAKKDDEELWWCLVNNGYQINDKIKNEVLEINPGEKWQKIIAETEIDLLNHTINNNPELKEEIKIKSKKNRI
jgi:hypothetical protein